MQFLLIAIFILSLIWLINRIRSPWLRALVAASIFGTLLSVGVTILVMLAIYIAMDHLPEFRTCFVCAGLFIYPLIFQTWRDTFA